jgi:hypothetical protein
LVEKVIGTLIAGISQVSLGKLLITASKPFLKIF